MGKNVRFHKIIEPSSTTVYNLLLPKENRSSLLDYFSHVLSLNKKKSQIQANDAVLAGDGFMLNFLSGWVFISPFSGPFWAGLKNTDRLNSYLGISIGIPSSLPLFCFSSQSRGKTCFLSSSTTVLCNPLLPVMLDLCVKVDVTKVDKNYYQSSHSRVDVSEETRINANTEEAEEFTKSEFPLLKPKKMWLQKWFVNNHGHSYSVTYAK